MKTLEASRYVQERTQEPGEATRARNGPGQQPHGHVPTLSPQTEAFVSETERQEVNV